MVSVVAGKHCFMVSVAGFSMNSAVAGGFKILESIEWFLVLGVFKTGFLFWGFLRLVSVAGCFYGFRRGRKTLFMVSVVGFLMVSVVARNAFLWFPSLVVLMVSGCYRTAALSLMETIKIKKNNTNNKKKKTSGRFHDELRIYVLFVLLLWWLWLLLLSVVVVVVAAAVVVMVVVVVVVVVLVVLVVVLALVLLSLTGQGLRRRRRLDHTLGGGRGRRLLYYIILY